MVVAPAVRDATRAMTIFEIALDIGGEPFTLVIPEMFSIDRTLLPRAQASVAAHEDDIRRALDRLFTGF